eukprot:TRINITY_DN2425_c0_g1_i12.p1 TRINITY_DN2425_c0_g1~~TRINITY_DN2425_c0_g1_i12.p1  ORF type:complete len:207 (+),score=-18.39 TRINITY_DN2425_c0_g1_i12:175-795(+)
MFCFFVVNSCVTYFTFQVRWSDIVLHLNFKTKSRSRSYFVLVQKVLFKSLSLKDVLFFSNTKSIMLTLRYVLFFRSKFMCCLFHFSSQEVRYRPAFKFQNKIKIIFYISLKCFDRIFVVKRCLVFSIRKIVLLTQRFCFFVVNPCVTYCTFQVSMLDIVLYLIFQRKRTKVLSHDLVVRRKRTKVLSHDLVVRLVYKFRIKGFLNN